MYELFYSTGGHGGPYRSTFEAKLQALRLLQGNPSERSITVRPANDYRIVLARITRKHLMQFRAMGQDE